MSERLQKTSLRAVAASALTAVGIGGVLLLPAAAVADDGDRRQTVSCGTLESKDSSGVVHAKIRNCTVTWGKNIIDGSYWQTVKFQLLDSRTDGVCARARVAGEHGSKDFSECNGVWTTKTANFSGRTSDIFISIGYGHNAWDLTHYKAVLAPSGF
ncbi:hypothetical protein [Streptomyces sp. V1I1]|uniref:hypothetical protein n=1 Tax=Streptomyces sp. V1I1 TaxID=3042272 RepID=UPI0027848A7F|nr:hypothetical protein [Streptomyces sp. V1I1]MDQ0938849.1 hypothetical protein [Streptomyces sp. V1I1]